MYTVKATYDGVNFKPEQPFPTQGQYEVIITFLTSVNQEDEPCVPDDLPILEQISKTNINRLQILLAPDSNKTPIIGQYDGMVTIPDDFKEPLEEMKEYMY